MQSATMTDLSAIAVPDGTESYRHRSSRFRILIAAQRGHDSGRIYSNVECLGAECELCENVDRLQSILESVDCGLAIISLDFWENGARHLLESWSPPKNVRFALWVGNQPVDIDSIVQAIRLGAAAVLHGESCERKLQMLVRESQLATTTKAPIPAESIDRCLAPFADRSVEPGDTSTDTSTQRTLNDRSIVGSTRPASVPRLRNGTNGSHSSNSADFTSYHSTHLRTPSPARRDLAPEEQLERFILGNSASIHSIRERIVNVASTRATVMVFGESGTGKELVARAIHYCSDRSQEPFVPVNMSAIPEGLAESLLFGHEKGSFTSAHEKHQGWCQTAHGGTLFLDEIGDMELAVQPKLLRFLQEGTLQTIGAKSSSHVDVRLITATNRDPRSIVREGRLREDLFFRLHVVPIHIPPLRERREDIPMMADFFLRRAAQRHGRNVKGLSDEAMQVLSRFNWPGNVRQLENAIERVVIFARDEMAQAMDIPAEFHAPARLWNSPENEALQTQRSGDICANNSNACDSMEPAVQLTPFQLNERTAIIDALQRTAGHVVDAAKLLGLGQATMYRKIKQYAVPNERKRRKVSSK